MLHSQNNMTMKLTYLLAHNSQEYSMNQILKKLLKYNAFDNKILDI